MPKQIKKPFYRQRTFWSGMGFVVSGLLGFVAEWITPEQAKAAMIVFGGLSIVFMREAVENSKPFEIDDNR
jgi:hypothetical protein